MFSKLGNWASNANIQAPAKADDGASLNSVLDTPALRTELVLLVLLCTDAMRSDLVAIFDASQTNCSSASPSPLPSPAPAEENLINFDSPQDGTTTAAERARKQRESEISSTQMQELRRAALTFFDKWRSGVLHRICDVVAVRGETVRRAKAKRKEVEDATERQKRDKQYWDWAAGEDGGESQNQNKGNISDQQAIYAPISTHLTQFDEPKRVFILHCILLLLLSLKHYPAHSRVLLLHLASSLQLSGGTLAEHEKSVAQGLLATAASTMDADEATKKKAADDATARKWKVGLATVGGAVLIGVTGGLAAPLLAAGVGTVMGGLGLGATVISGYLGALAGSGVLVGTLFGAYGGKMTGRMMDQYAKEVEDFRFIPIRASYKPASQYPTERADVLSLQDREQQQQHRLRVAIGISGWINSSVDIVKPWNVLNHSGIEPFALRWELAALLRLGRSLTDVLKSYAWEGAKVEIVRRTLLGALYAGLWPIGLLRMASVLDNPFSVAVARSDKAGKVLAHALISKVQGERPVTLIGYSLGARVIYSCLLELAEQNAFGLVESVILMGAPTPSDSSAWRRIRAVVSARVVNVYSTEDFILGFLYRTSKVQLGVAGLQEVKGVYGIQNVDMSSLVTGHNRYQYLVGTILRKVGFEDVDTEQVEEQVEALRIVEVKEKEEKRGEGETNMKVKEDVPWKISRKELPDPLALVHEPSNSHATPSMSQIPLAAQPRYGFPTSHDQPHDESEEEDGRIVMMDLEDEDKPASKQHEVMKITKALTIKKTEVHREALKVEVMPISSESDTDSISSVPLGELAVLDPTPEPEPEVETVQFGSSVRGFQLTWDTR
ncbi:DUF726-domain-containing protein [Glonium stellatum]|uniref:DUF726-domain-containing protein n=1 Tax=Glonium stellatum TaxID=574774 RepID=A0A8E2JT24_9PEZI|nr:DUF726-domain-containing protein [Glonium stellatum]